MASNADALSFLIALSSCVSETLTIAVLPLLPGRSLLFLLGSVIPPSSFQVLRIALGKAGRSTVRIIFSLVWTDARLVSV